MREKNSSRGDAQAAAQQRSLSLPTGLPEGWVPTPAEGLSPAEAAARAERGQANPQALH